ncbi:MAG TPA: mannose-1-phosphate guanylyltransferase/mannose-6-phosphate isomerase [Trinickia sp.]|uniref:mannose-1-phosphate guanylyltransferase/mannose-6-phosphate isomerase n=1 Tax=Trinickia sp. TaxID=2571163 RepID=UPI002C278B3D|nr:mannose-1-phosphate guanylyltransferase/mannose-6-phosphate isomerase [Trinickia sp.]HVW51208.1 mannose-1-phosphate guanylyltransferase/mannose-6-phosphate isomerase [Trinickia sp.]
MSTPVETRERPRKVGAVTQLRAPHTVAPQSALRTRAVVLAGGSGTRLWPLSRKHFPKQLVDVLGAGSLLQMTVQRLQRLADVELRIDDSPIIVCGSEHRAISAQQMEQLGVGAQFIIEPTGRNTAPALSLAAMHALADGGDAVLVVMPADHMIGDVAAFQRAVAVAARHAERGAIVTLGIRPTRAETGYGYIEPGDEIGDARKIARFVEKPPLEVARSYLASGKYFWNSGIFVLRASVWLSTLQQMQPETFAACTAAYEAGEDSATGYKPNEQLFADVPSDSIDYAVMENLTRGGGVEGVVVPLDAAWSDLGSWDSVWDALGKDASGNVASGRVLMEDAQSCYVRAESRLVTCVGVSDLVVVETADAVLVVDRSRVQDVKRIVGRIADQQGPEVDAHRKVQRPWGCYDSIDKGERFQVKHIVVEAGAQLSLQLHHHRAEHWIVVRGTALVTRGEEQFLLGENQSTYIPLGVKHRLENPGKVPLELIEVQSGAYLGEDDIVRFEDVYGRAS